MFEILHNATANSEFGAVFRVLMLNLDQILNWYNLALSPSKAIAKCQPRKGETSATGITRKTIIGAELRKK